MSYPAMLQVLLLHLQKALLRKWESFKHIRRLHRDFVMFSTWIIPDLNIYSVQTEVLLKITEKFTEKRTEKEKQLSKRVFIYTMTLNSLDCLIQKDIFSDSTKLLFRGLKKTPNII